MYHNVFGLLKNGLYWQILVDFSHSILNSNVGTMMYYTSSKY